MQGLIIFAFALASSIRAEDPVANWTFLDMNNPLGLLKDVPPVGFEPSNVGGVDSNIPLYLCLLYQGGRWKAGKLVFQQSGDIVCSVTVLGREVSIRYDSRSHNLIQVLKTPVECWSWVPYDSTDARPEHWIKGTTVANEFQTPICRVYDSKFGFIIPGSFGHHRDNQNKCWYPFDGEMWATTNIEVLVWNEYAFVNMAKCNRANIHRR